MTGHQNVVLDIQVPKSKSGREPWAPSLFQVVGNVKAGSCDPVMLHEDEARVVRGGWSAEQTDNSYR